MDNELEELRTVVDEFLALPFIKNIPPVKDSGDPVAALIYRALAVREKLS